MVGWQEPTDGRLAGGGGGAALPSLRDAGTRAGSAKPATPLEGAPQDGAQG